MASTEQDEKTSIRLNEVAGSYQNDTSEDDLDNNQNNKNGYEDLSHNDEGKKHAIIMYIYIVLLAVLKNIEIFFSIFFFQT